MCLFNYFVWGWAISYLLRRKKKFPRFKERIKITVIICYGGKNNKNNYYCYYVFECGARNVNGPITL